MDSQDWELIGWWRRACQACGAALHPEPRDAHPSCGGRSRLCPACTDPRLIFWDEYALLGDVGPAIGSIRQQPS
jgi:hypothetical protein